MEVSVEDGVGSNRVYNDLRHLSPLDVDQSLGEVGLDLDAVGHALSQVDQDGGLESLLQLWEELVGVALKVTFTWVELFLSFNELHIFGLDGQFPFGEELDVEFVLHFKSSVLVVDDGNSLHHTTTDTVNVFCSWRPGVGVLLRGDSGQNCQGKEAEGNLHGELSQFLAPKK